MAEPLTAEDEARRYAAAQKPLDGPERAGAIHAYNVRQMLDVAMRALRDCEDYARLTSNNEPLADRCRVLHEQLTEDLVNGGTAYPTYPELREQNAQALTTIGELREREARFKHLLTLEPNAVGDRWEARCSCGWSSGFYDSDLAATERHERHREHCLDRTALAPTQSPEPREGANDG
jgi:hypothetical protein